MPIKVARRELRHAAEVVDPQRRATLAALRHTPAPPAAYLAVYTAADDDSVRRVGRMAAEAAGVGWTVRLWALDEPHPSLSRWTAGYGPGMLNQNINRLADQLDDSLWLIKSDDDVRMRDGDLVTWIKLSDRAHLDFSQPGHGQGSFCSHQITNRNMFCTYRETTFVEVGPLTAFSPRVRRRVLPLPEEGFGWGTELAWYDLLEDGYRIGVVDALPMWHMRMPASTYEAGIEHARQERLFAARGISGWPDIQRVTRRARTPFLRAGEGRFRR